MEELKHRYAQIGLGETPGEEPPALTKWTMVQGRLLEQALEARASTLRCETGIPISPTLLKKMRRMA